MSRSSAQNPRKAHYDVCVIGSGAAGGVMAWELARQGADVLLMEAGPRFIHGQDEFPQFLGSLYRSPVYTPPSKPFDLTLIRAVGGATVVYGAVALRFSANDFKSHTIDGVGEDWPISYEDLAPYYERVETLLGVTGNDEDLPQLPAGRYLPPISPTPVEAEFGRRLQAHGVRLIPTRKAIVTRAYDGRPECCYRAACSEGCPIQAKSSTDVACVPKALATGRCELLTGANVARVELGPQGLARDVIYVDLNREMRRIQAGVVVLCCSCVESARLLLNSSSGRFPDGLANSSGEVGQNFFEHLTIPYYGYLPDILPAKGFGTWDNTLIPDFYDSSPRDNFVKGFQYHVAPARETDMFQLARLVPGLGQPHQDAVRRHVYGGISLLGVGEMLPNRHSRVTVMPDQEDEFGIPPAAINFEIGENDRRLIRGMTNKARELIELAGGMTPANFDGGYVPGASHHYMGTCKMGSDPSRSVVNPWCQTHDVKNLFVVDSSCFVSGAAKNISLTIQALAARSADYIVESRRRLEL